MTVTSCSMPPEWYMRVVLCRAGLSWVAVSESQLLRNQLAEELRRSRAELAQSASTDRALQQEKDELQADKMQLQVCGG